MGQNAMTNIKEPTPGYTMVGFPIPIPGKNEIRPNERDAEHERGVLAYVADRMMVMDLGAPRDERSRWRGTPSPSRADFTPGVVNLSGNGKPFDASAPVQGDKVVPVPKQKVGSIKRY